MKKLWYAACAAVLCAVLSSCASHEVKYRSPGPDVSTEFALSAEAANRVGREYPIYKPVSERKSSPEEYDRKLFRAFGVGNTEGEALDNGMKYTCDNGASLTIFEDGGYCYDFLAVRAPKENQTEEKATEVLENFLRQRGLEMPAEPFRARRHEVYVKDDAYGDSYAVEIVDFYPMAIDGYYVLYGDADMHAYVQADEVYYIISKYEGRQIDRMVSCRSLEEIAKLELKKIGETYCPPDVDREDKGPYSYDSDTPVIFTDVEICLEKNGDFYQPVYTFKGTRCDVDGNEHRWEWMVPAFHD